MRAMRRALSFAAVLLGTLAAAWAGDTYCNPLDVIIADPYVLQVGKEYYLYGTTDSRHGFEVYRSTNLVDWTYGGWVLERSTSNWGRSHFWAPECFAHRGKYYLVYTASTETTSMRIGLAESDSPAGPFKNVKAPWIDPGQAVIDADVFRDTDGQLYVYYVIDCSENKFSEIRVAKVGDDLSVSPGDSALVARPSQKWEGSKWNEGPQVIKHGETYYLMYSANGYMDEKYSVGYATAKNPMGPWTKYEGNPILQRAPGAPGPGHNGVAMSPDGKEMFIVYHTLQNPGFNAARQLAMDRLTFAPGPLGGPDMLKVEGPTTRPQPFPSGDAALVRGKGDDFNASKLDRRKWTVFGENPRTWALRSGRLVIETEDGDVADRRDDLRNLFLQYAPTGNFEVVAKVNIRATENYEHAFLMLWQDHDHFVKLATVFSDRPRLEVGIEQDGTYDSHLFDNTLGDTVYLRIARTGDRSAFSASRDGKRWITLMEDVGMTLDDLRVGIGAASPGTTAHAKATFDFITFTTR